MTFNIILTTDINNGISKYNKMPWNSVDDLQFFNKHTMNNICIMGSKTAKDYQKPLKDRVCIVISSKSKEDLDLDPEFIIENNFENSLKKAEEIQKESIRRGIDKEIFVIGGSRVFNEALQSKKLNKIYYVNINRSFDCDNFVDKILDRNDMKYEILNTIKVNNIDLESTNNKISGDIILTFYKIEKKIEIFFNIHSQNDK
jgi:dihydrofolate reductase